MKKVKLITANNVNDFCNIASIVDGEVKAESLDRVYKINAKSVLGVFSLALGETHEILVTVNASAKVIENTFWEQLKLVGIEVIEM